MGGPAASYLYIYTLRRTVRGAALPAAGGKDRILIDGNDGASGGGHVVLGQ